jgi:ParB family chromosome partitioning protein
MNDIARVNQNELTLYDPEKGLIEIATAQAGELHYRRAKDATQLCAAIDAKIDAEAAYVVWRDGIVREGRPRKNSRGNAVVLPKDDPGQDVADHWRKSFCRKVKIDGSKKTKTVRDDNRIAAAKAAAQRLAVRACEREKTDTTRGTTGTGWNEWCSPDPIPSMARYVMGDIDVDPASTAFANKTVKARIYFTKQDDGLSKPWGGRVYLNPPYSRRLIRKFVSKLCAEYRAGRVPTAILLTHNFSDASWFREAAQLATAICFTRRRVKFYEPNGKIARPTQGQALFYFGPDANRFVECFRTIAHVHTNCEDPEDLFRRTIPRLSDNQLRQGRADIEAELARRDASIVDLDRIRGGSA